MRHNCPYSFPSLSLRRFLPSAMSPFLLLLFFVNGFFSFTAFGSLRLELIHRHSDELSASETTQIERMADLVRIDHHRIHMISRRVGGRGRRDLETKRSSSTSPALIPIHSGASTGTGQYFVRFRVGTPSQTFLLVADTGSDLTWMNCRYNCKNCTRRIQGRRVFHTRRSSSFKTISCSSEACLTLPFSLAQCSTPTTPCQYDYQYQDGSTADGIFATETVRVGLANGRKIKLHKVVVGCTTALEGSSFDASDGVLGLGYSNSSFVMTAKEKFGGKFSYCLVDHLSPKNVTSYLTFGHTVTSSRSHVGLLNMQYTSLKLNVITGFYPIHVAGISIGGVMLDIPSYVWNVSGQGGVIIDSGTSLTFLAEPAYTLVMNALKVPLLTYTQEIELKPFEFCFGSASFDESLVPKLVVHFADSARFEPPVKSYVINVSEGVKCLGFMSNGWPGVSILGNIMQQNFMWEFDTANKKLGFAPSACTTN